MRQSTSIVHSSPTQCDLTQGQFKACDVTTSGNKILSISKHGAGQPGVEIESDETSSMQTLPAIDDADPSTAAKQCLLWVQQEIEPDVPQKLPPRTVRGVLRRASRKEMGQFIDVRSSTALLCCTQKLVGLAPQNAIQNATQNHVELHCVVMFMRLCVRPW